MPSLRLQLTNGPVPQGVAHEEPPGAPYCRLSRASHPGLRVSPVQTFPQHVPPGL